MWEDGKRIEWFDRETADNIIKGRIDFKSFFRKTESGDWVQDNCSFGKPLNFDKKLSDIKKRFGITN